MKRFLIIPALLLAAPAMAQETQCGPTESVYKFLADDYGETRQISLLATGGQAIVEVFINEETGTWTIVATGTTGRTCMVTNGVGFTIAAPMGEPG